MNEDEKVVREAWQDPDHYLGDFNRNLYPADMDDWMAIRLFTEERKRQIAEIEEEIHEFDALATCGEVEPWMMRILTRLTAARDELQRGMRRTQ